MKRTLRRVASAAPRLLGLVLQTIGVAMIASDAFVRLLLPHGSGSLSVISALGLVAMMMGGLAIRPRWLAVVFPLVMLLLASTGLALLAIAMAARG